MENKSSEKSLQDAFNALAEDMAARDIGAVVWDLSVAGFPYIPEVTEVIEGKSTRQATDRVTGIYNYNGEIYAIIEGESGVSVNDYYNRDYEVRPSVITLTPDMAESRFGNPAAKRGFTSEATLQEWLAIADCYYQSLAED